MPTQDGTADTQTETQTLSPVQDPEPVALEVQTNVNVVASPPAQQPPTTFPTPPVLSERDLRSFQDRTHLKLYENPGAHPAAVDGVAGTQFAIWAPNAVNSDAQIYGGAGQGNAGGVEAVTVKCHHRPNSLSLTLPPSGALFLHHRD